MSTCYFRVVPAQARPKMRAGPCSPPCRDSGHDTALVFVSCRHGPKYFVSYRVSGRAKRPCHDPPSNGTAQVPALASAAAKKKISQPNSGWTLFLPLGWLREASLESNRRVSIRYQLLMIISPFSISLPCPDSSS
jgi:hypothetical protein